MVAHEKVRVLSVDPRPMLSWSFETKLSFSWTSHVDRKFFQARVARPPKWLRRHRAIPSSYGRAREWPRRVRRLRWHGADALARSRPRRLSLELVAGGSDARE